jgi:hypothetical protein
MLIPASRAEDGLISDAVSTRLEIRTPGLDAMRLCCWLWHHGGIHAACQQAPTAAESHGISDLEQDLIGAGEGLAKISLEPDRSGVALWASPDRNTDFRLAAFDIARTEAKRAHFSEKITTTALDGHRSFNDADG